MKGQHLKGGTQHISEVCSLRVMEKNHRAFSVLDLHDIGTIVTVDSCASEQT